MDIDKLPSEQETSHMPVLFIGHGTPMNAIEDNEFTIQWKRLADDIPHPKAILCISAHWETNDSAVTAMEHPETIHDFGGFPRELYAQQYPAKGNSKLADILNEQLHEWEVRKDYEWGLDHGTWCFLKHMYPNADIPVLQLSIDYTKPIQYHYDLARQLLFLRRMGVLIAGSGNMVHNLGLARPGINGFNTDHGYDWALELNELFKEKILAGDHPSIINYRKLSKWAYLGIPSEEHFIPLIYTLALQTAQDKIKIFNDKVVAGSLSMTSLLIDPIG